MIVPSPTLYSILKLARALDLDVGEVLRASSGRIAAAEVELGEVWDRADVKLEASVF